MSLSKSNHTIAIQAFYPKLIANKDIIEGTTRKTFQYGPTERHQVTLECELRALDLWVSFLMCIA